MKANNDAQAAATERKSLKAEQEEMNEILSRTITLIIYHTVSFPFDA